MEIPNSVRYFQRLNEMVKELAKEVESETKREKIATNQSQYEEMCEVYERYNKGSLIPVVRCKDCKYAYENAIAMCGHVTWYNKEDDFCSRGERREDADKINAYLQKNSVNHILTVDAVEVVRCKDCKHYWKNNPSDDVPVCLASPKDDAFCSEGERREDETD